MVEADLRTEPGERKGGMSWKLIESGGRVIDPESISATVRRAGKKLSIHICIGPVVATTIGLALGDYVEIYKGTHSDRRCGLLKMVLA